MFVVWCLSVVVKFVRCWLSVGRARCVLFVVCCLCVYCLCFVVCCIVFVVHGVAWLFGVCGSLFALRCLFVVRCLLCVAT